MSEVTESVNGKPDKKEKLTQASRQLVGDFEGYFAEVFADTDFELKLYRCEVSGRKIKRTFLKRFVNEWPQEESIGTEFGAGHYDIRGVHPMEPEKLHSKEIHIDEIWNKIKRERDRENFEAMNGPSMRQVPQPQDPIETFSKVLGTLEPLLKVLGGTSQAQNPVAQLPSIMEGFQKMFVDSMKSMNKMQMESLSEIQEKQKQLMNTEPAAEEPQTMTDHLKIGILETIKAAADRFLNAGGFEEKFMKKAIKESDEYQALVNDEQTLSEVYTEAIIDPEIGKEKIDKLFKKLGIEVPEELPEVEQPINEGAANEP